MDVVLRRLHWDIAQICLDDVIIASKDFEEQHFGHFRIYNLKLELNILHISKKKGVLGPLYQC